MAEQVGHFRSRVDRIANTMELSDYFGGTTEKSPTDFEPCYGLKSVMDISRVADDQTCEGARREAEAGLEPLLDVLLKKNPDFAVVSQLSEMPETEFEVREYQRPAGYSATSRVHVGRLCVPTLNDSGATCSCITEEQVVLIVNHTYRMLNHCLLYTSPSPRDS